MGTLAAISMVKELKCGSAPLWIGITVFFVCSATAMFISAGVEGFCDISTDCPSGTGLYLDFSTETSVGSKGCTNRREVPLSEVCDECGEYCATTTYKADGFSVGGFIALIIFGALSLLIAMVTSCGICPCACFSTEVEHANPDHHQEVVAATAVQSAVPTMQAGKSTDKDCEAATTEDNVAQA